MQIRITETISVETHSDNSVSNRYATTIRQCGPKEEQEGVESKEDGKENVKMTDYE